MKNLKPYEAFGTLLSSLRARAGIANQKELAIRIKATQQTISRYEKGESRPKNKDLPLMASVLGVDIGQLLTAAGYSPEVAIATFDQPFPVEALPPDSFERFSFYLLDKLYTGAKVHRAGGTGHKQDGLDIEITLPDGSVHTFQCKRVNDFGPAKVKKAIDAHTRAAQQKHLLLSRIASPQARAEVAQHTDWDIWDKEDISLKIRSLPRVEQIQLVDIFFAGKRLPLLGETEAGPWLTLEEFFAPFMNQRSAFNHQWALVGRETEQKTLIASLADNTTIVTLLTGPGGSGKTRLLADCVKAHAIEHPGTLIRVLSATEEVSSKALGILGSGPKILVIDDAHEREDLRVLFQFVVNPANKTRLMISARPYGRADIFNQASAFNISVPLLSELSLKPLSLEAATSLARQVLVQYKGPEEAAEDIARITLDCTLATVMGAQIVATEKIHPELMQNEANFRGTLLSRFASVLAGEIASGADIDRLQRLLRVLALVQPFTPEDQDLLQLLHDYEDISFADGNRLIKLLIDAGVLFKRGGKYRISPDLLADHIIEINCIASGGGSSGYAEQVFDKAPSSFLQRILVNLGKIDWRRANGKPTNSRLLDKMWGKLRPTDSYKDAHMEAMSAVAYYQPARALDFAEMSIREGKVFDGLINVVRHAAYNFEFFTRACICLWEMGKDDSRELNRHQNHAIRLLNELCAVTPNKPLEYNEKAVEFGLQLLERPDAWTHTFSPYEILEGILQTEGHTSTSNGRTFSFNTYSINWETVKAMRVRVIDAAISRLDHMDFVIAIQSASFLEKAIHGPMGAMGLSIPHEEYELWIDEFLNTFGKIEQKLKSSALDPAVYVEIRRSICWHVNYSNSRTAPAARQLINLLPASLQDRTLLALVDGNGRMSEMREPELQEEKWETTVENLCNELIHAFSQQAELLDYLENQLVHIKRTKLEKQNLTPYVLYGQLLRKSPGLRHALLEKIIVNASCNSVDFSGTALSYLLQDDLYAGIAFITRMLDAGQDNLKVAVISAIEKSAWRATLPKQLLDILRHIMSSDSFDLSLALPTIDVIRAIAETDPRLAEELLTEIDFGNSAKLADRALSIYGYETEIGVEKLSINKIQIIFNKLLYISKLDGHWIQTFLSKASLSYPTDTAKFFMKRVEHALQLDDYSYQPCSRKPTSHVKLKFSESPVRDFVLRQVWEWMRSQSGSKRLFLHHAADFFSSAFFPVDDALVIFMQERIRGDSIDIQLIAAVLREAGHTLVFDHTAFVVELLEVARKHGQEISKTVFSALYGASTTGIRSGTAGEPYPRDLEAKSCSETILQKLSPISPAYRLYDLIKKNAEQEIATSRRENEEFEDI